MKVEKPAEVQPVEAVEVDEEPVEAAEPTEIPAEPVQPSKVRRCAECLTLACTQYDAVTGAECFTLAGSDLRSIGSAFAVPQCIAVARHLPPRWFLADSGIDSSALGPQCASGPVTLLCTAQQPWRGEKGCLEFCRTFPSPDKPRRERLSV